MKSTALVVFLAATGVLANAQEAAPTPKAEVGLNYSFTNLFPGSGASSFMMQGGSGTFVYNLNSTLGVVADLGGYHNGSAVNLDPTMFSYLFGPRVSLRKARFTPYFQALFGGARVSTNLVDFLNGGNTVTANNFAMAFGGGLDVRVNDHIAVKPFEVEYLMTQFPNLWTPNDVQHNLRYSAGLVFRFGSK